MPRDSGPVCSATCLCHSKRYNTTGSSDELWEAFTFQSTEEKLGTFEDEKKQMSSRRNEQTSLLNGRVLRKKANQASSL